jgi:hypothetical protein
VVRHGADPRMALAAVLGLAAEDIQVTESAGSEPRVKVSMVRPNNPSPNTEVAALPGNAGPDFPSGDN